MLHVKGSPNFYVCIIYVFRNSLNFVGKWHFLKVWRSFPTLFNQERELRTMYLAQAREENLGRKNFPGEINKKRNWVLWLDAAAICLLCFAQKEERGSFRKVLQGGVLKAQETEISRSFLRPTHTSFFFTNRRFTMISTIFRHPAHSDFWLVQ